MQINLDNPAAIVTGIGHGIVPVSLHDGEGEKNGVVHTVGRLRATRVQSESLGVGTSFRRVRMGVVAERGCQRSS